MEQVSVDPPLHGEWKVIYNSFDTTHALDFIGFQAKNRLPYPSRSVLPHIFYRISASTAFDWGRPVYAPFDGEVLEARDGYPDTVDMKLVRDVLGNLVFLPGPDENIQRFAGNYVVIEGVEATAFLAHFQPDSITITSGGTMTAGMQIGSVGNAGASLVPHLHFQLLSEWSSNISVIAEKDRLFHFSQYER